jgi:hypothetical protein
LEWLKATLQREFGALAGSRGSGRPSGSTVGGGAHSRFNWKAWDVELATFAPLLLLLLHALVGYRAGAASTTADSVDDDDGSDDEFDGSWSDVDGADAPASDEQDDDWDWLGLAGSPARLALIFAAQLAYFHHQRCSAFARLVAYNCYGSNVSKSTHSLLHAAALAISYNATTKTMRRNAAHVPTLAEFRARLGKTLLGYDNGQRFHRVALPQVGKLLGGMLHFCAALLWPLPPPTPEEIQAALLHGDQLKPVTSLTLQDVMATAQDIDIFMQRCSRLVANAVIRMAFAAASPAAERRGVSLAGPLVQLVKHKVEMTGFADERPLPLFHHDQLVNLAQVQPPALYTARLSSCPDPVPLPVVFENMGTAEGTLHFLQGAQEQGLMPKIFTNDCIVLDKDTAATHRGKGVQLVGGDVGTTTAVRRLASQMRAEPNPLNKFDEVVAVHGPLHCQMENLRQLGKPQFWGKISEPGSIAWVLNQLQNKVVKPDADKFHACMHFHVDVLLPAYLRGMFVRCYPGDLRVILTVAADKEAALAACDKLAAQLVDDVFVKQSASP